jgi:hypothetical protein
MIAMLDKLPANIEKKVIFGVRNEKDIYYGDVLAKFPNTKTTITVSKPSENYE